MILTAAVAAPSGDNTQPWRLRWRDGCLELWIDEKRSGRSSDASYLLSDLALGACLENICIQAAALGYSAQVNLFPAGQSEPLWVATIVWGDGAAENALLASVIMRRHTDRTFPWTSPSDAVCRRLEACCARRSGALLSAVSRGRMRKEALRLLMQSEALRFADRTLHEELFRAVRFDVGWHRTCEEGLPPGALGIERPLRPFFKALRNWALMRVLNMFGAASVLGVRAALLPVVTSPMLFVLQAESLERKHVVSAGRMLERFWLNAEAEGLSVQPFAAVGAVIYGGACLDKRLEKRRTELRARSEALFEAGSPLIFLRVGVSRVPESSLLRSGRRGTNDFALPNV